MAKKNDWEKPEWQWTDDQRHHMEKDPFSTTPIQIEMRKMVALERLADTLDKILDRLEGVEEALQLTAHGNSGGPKEKTEKKTPHAY